jgi:predicted TIM-barrel fold metal-dependent hydrolase
MLVETAPDRLVWATDWPHSAAFPPDDGRTMPNDGALLDLLADWVPDAALRARILVDNPARLYGFA